MTLMLQKYFIPGGAAARPTASTNARLRAAGSISAAMRLPLAKLFSLRRALASAIGTPSSRAPCSRFGQTSVSISTPMAGR